MAEKMSEGLENIMKNITFSDSKTKLFVIGLDSAPPELLFNEFVDDLPNIRKILENSIYGGMESSIPAITIPAWMCMATGKTPGELGLYGFRHRKGNSYKDVWIAHSLKIKEKTIWDYLGERGFESVVVGVPPSYPPKKIKGNLISCFITPDSSVNYTYPESLRNEVEKLVGEYVFDVIFRKEDRDAVLEEIIEMTKKRFEVVRYLIQEKNWKYFEFVEIGLDRIHHAFWKYFDRSHHLYEKSEYESVIPEYYKLLDKEIGKTVKLLDENTAISIVSDHGIQAMRGAFAINQWLIEEGYLKLRNSGGVDEVKRRFRATKLEQLEIDWDKTVAWAWGGYYSRIFINLKGREKRGVVSKHEYESLRDELSSAIRSIKGENGEKWDTKVFYPEEIYPVAKGDKPDMMVYFDNLRWRSAGTIGYESNYLLENDTGPDDAVHSEYGVFVLAHPEMRGNMDGQKCTQKQVQISIYDFPKIAFTAMGMRDLAEGLR
jgi:predicted AlkP superfamily phosphohydrolase/phosphomutase